MKRIFNLLVLVPSIVFSQNVGIGTTTPVEKLDVAGSINVSGAIKANGVAGLPGQVLTTNSTGNIEWNNNNTGIDFGYANFVGFYGILDSVETWTIPNGVTKILVEAWGGGGGGSFGGGGAGGGYVRSQFSVNAGTVISITAGVGGAGSVNNSTESGRTGGTTLVTVRDKNNKLWYVLATGGTGAYNNPGLSFISSYNPGGSFYVVDQYPVGPGVSIYPHFIGAAGEAGYPNYFTYTQTGSTTFLQEATGGRGGDAGNSIKTGGGGARNFSDNSFSIVSRHAGYGGAFGGGGGSGMPGVSDGRPGGKGKVVIWY